MVFIFNTMPAHLSDKPHGFACSNHLRNLCNHEFQFLNMEFNFQTNIERELSNHEFDLHTQEKYLKFLWHKINNVISTQDNVLQQN